MPAPEMVQSLVQDTHRRSKPNSDGKNSQAYPALARVPSELFGICVVGASGRIYGAGDVGYEFSIMIVSKPFLFALICETIGPEEARAKLGANATGLPFNSLAKIAVNPLLPKEIQAQVDLGNITCVSNDQLRSVMEKTTATPQQVQEALRVNAEARLRALKIGLLFMAGLPLLAVIRPTSFRTTFRERSQAMSQGQRPEIDLISLARHVPWRVEEDVAQRREPMDAIDRRSALRGILCVAVAAGFSASSLPNTVEAMPLALEKGLGNEADDLKVKVQAVASRPPPRPVPRPRRRRHRRWVCRWHRGRRVCGWRW